MAPGSPASLRVLARLQATSPWGHGGIKQKLREAVGEGKCSSPGPRTLSTTWAGASLTRRVSTQARPDTGQGQPFSSLGCPLGRTCVLGSPSPSRPVATRGMISGSKSGERAALATGDPAWKRAQGGSKSHSHRHDG